MEYVKIFTAKDEIEAQILKGRLWDKGIQVYLRPNEANLKEGQPSFELDWDIEVLEVDKEKAQDMIKEVQKKKDSA